MNLTECCHTIGCNCGGTAQIEMLNKIAPWMLPLIIVIAGIIFFVIFLNLREQPIDEVTYR